MEGNGQLEADPPRQALHWMWSLVDEGVRAAVREHPEVKRRIERLERDVVDGTMSATAAAEEILAAFGIGG